MSKRPVLASITLLVGLLIVAAGVQSLLLILADRSNPPRRPGDLIVDDMPFLLGVLALPGGIVLVVKGASALLARKGVRRDPPRSRQ